MALRPGSRFPNSSANALKRNAGGHAGVSNKVYVDTKISAETLASQRSPRARLRSSSLGTKRRRRFHVNKTWAIMLWDANFGAFFCGCAGNCAERMARREKGAPRPAGFLRRQFTASSRARRGPLCPTKQNEESGWVLRSARPSKTAGGGGSFFGPKDFQAPSREKKPNPELILTALFSGCALIPLSSSPAPGRQRQLRGLVASAST